MNNSDNCSAVCGLCQTERWQHEELKPLPIFINGSEGILLCPDCDLAITNHISAMRSVACRSKLQALTKTGLIEE